jgi:hypothetical protein
MDTEIQSRNRKKEIMISADYFRRNSDLEILNVQDLVQLEYSDREGRTVYVKSSVAEVVLRRLLNANPMKIPGALFILHGDDVTISNATAQEVVSQGHRIKSVNWLGDISLVEPIPLGLPTFDRLSRVSRKEFSHFTAELENLSKGSIRRDIRLYANFDITTNLPLRKAALLEALRLDDTYSPVSRVGLIQNLEILSRSKFVLSPPGAGPDCFRTWEAIYLGAIPIVLRSHWPFNHLALPVLVVESFENLERDIASYEKNPPFSKKTWEEYFGVR